MPVPNTATVRPPAARAPRWAAASMPAARPLTTVTPASASRRASSAAMRRPYSLARRAPTIAIAGSSGPPRLPRTASTSGGWAMWRSAGGYAPSLQATSVAPALASFSVSARARPAAVPSEATAAGGTSAAASAPAGASSTARGVPKRSTSAKARRGSSSGTSASASHASAASSRGIVCVGAAMRRRSGYYTRRAVANHLALLHDRTARVAHARARSRAGGGRRIVGREVLLAGDELPAGEAHAVALRTHREEDGDRIGVDRERVPEPAALADRLRHLPRLDDHGLDRTGRVLEAVSLPLPDPLPAGRRQRIVGVEAVAGGGRDAEASARLRGITGHQARVLRDQHERLLRRLARVGLQEELRSGDGLSAAGREGGGGHRGGRGPNHGGGGHRADAVAGGRRSGEGEVRVVIASVAHALQAHGAVAGGQHRRCIIAGLQRSRVGGAVGDAVGIVLVGHAGIPRGRVLGRRQAAAGCAPADHAAQVVEGG